MLAVVDTNILVSGLRNPDGPPAAVLRGIQSQQLRPVLCTEVLDEYLRVLPRPRLLLTPEHIEATLELIKEQAEWVVVPPYPGFPPLPDRDDWPFLACALALNCPVITGNVKHFPEGTGVRVMTARGWVERDLGKHS